MERSHMEPRGCNRWQAVANGARPKSAETRETVARACDQLPTGAHGKEEVDGSSPSAGFASESSGSTHPVRRKHTGTAENLDSRSFVRATAASRDVCSSVCSPREIVRRRVEGFRDQWVEWDACRPRARAVRRQASSPFSRHTGVSTRARLGRGRHWRGRCPGRHV
jgi:hypothetical protein